MHEKRRRLAYEEQQEDRAGGCISVNKSGTIEATQAA